MKEKISFILTIVNTVAIVVLAILMVGNNQPLGGGTRMINGLSTDSTSPSAGQVRTATLLATATTTIAASYDGFVIYKQLTLSTTSNTTIFTNTYAPMLCIAGDGDLYSDSQSATLGPSFIVSLGTSSGVVPTANVLASTTIATTTDTHTVVKTTAFVLESGYSLVAGFGDYQAAASSTYYGVSYWKVHAVIPCTIIGP